MTLTHLQTAVADRVREIAKDLMFSVEYLTTDGTPTTELRTPTVYSGMAPMKQPGQSDCPAIVVRAKKGVDSVNDGSDADVSIMVLTYDASETAQGFDDVLNAIDRIRNGLLVNPTAGNRYRCQLPINWERFDEQPYPFWEGHIETTWRGARAQEEFDVES